MEPVLLTTNRKSTMCGSHTHRMCAHSFTIVLPTAVRGCAARGPCLAPFVSSPHSHMLICSTKPEAYRLISHPKPPSTLTPSMPLTPYMISALLGSITSSNKKHVLPKQYRPYSPLSARSPSNLVLYSLLCSLQTPSPLATTPATPRLIMNTVNVGS